MQPSTGTRTLQGRSRRAPRRAARHAGALALLLFLAGPVGTEGPGWGSRARASDPTPPATKVPPIKLQVSPPLVAPTRGEVDIWDANPALVPPKLARELYPDLFADGTHPATAGADAVERDETRRTGAVADGLSRLLIRARFDVPGRVSFELHGDDTGTIRALRIRGSQPGGERETDTFERDGLHVAYALYTPPRSFAAGQRTARLAPRTRPDKLRPGQTRTVALETRDVSLLVKWAERAGVRHRHTMHWPIQLLHPPVVLVHGTYDDGINCWDWDGDNVYRVKAEAEGLTDYVTDSFARQLEEDGFGVFVVNYRQSSGENPDFDRALPPPTREEAEAAAALPPAERERIARERAARAAEVRSRASRFEDNAWVVWDGGHAGHPDPGEGIKRALEYYRNELQIAVTRADVVGHSMGGVLARVYARGVPLAEPADRPGHNWFRRLDNWREGDINRLITVGSTHRGSHLPTLLRQYWDQLPLGAGRAWRAGNWWFGGRLAPGAFTDQMLGSDALRALGATAVPAHAIAGVATVSDLDRFDFSWGFGLLGESNYRQRVEGLWTKTPEWILPRILRGHTESSAGGATDMDADDLGQRKAAIDRVRAEIEAIDARARQDTERLEAALAKVATEENGIRGPGSHVGRLRPAGRFPEAERQRLEALDAERQRLQTEVTRIETERSLAAAPRTARLAELKERRFLRFVAAGFYNDWTDFTVSLESALGGVASDAPPASPELSRYVTVLPADFRTAERGVLHSYEPRHRAVQERIKLLLRGGLQRFNLDGFPGYAPPRYLAGDDPNAFRPQDAACTHAPRLCPAEAGR